MRIWACVVASLWLLPASLPARAQSSPGPAASLQAQCLEGSETAAGQAPLPNTARALRERKRIKVLAIGATPLSERDQEKGHYGLVEKALESNISGVDVEIIDRGVSGELARDSAERIKNDVALTEPDLVFWQVGVADALALTPADELKETLTEAVQWLKSHQVDVVLIGLRYQRSLAKDTGYQQIREVIRDVVREQSILRLRHYESIEALDRVRGQGDEPPSELDLTEASSLCLAELLSQALAARLFGKPRAGQRKPLGVQPAAPHAPAARPEPGR